MAAPLPAAGVPAALEPPAPPTAATAPAPPLSVTATVPALATDEVVVARVPALPLSAALLTLGIIEPLVPPEGAVGAPG
jgi:hypothetical protein